MEQVLDMEEDMEPVLDWVDQLGLEPSELQPQPLPFLQVWGTQEVTDRELELEVSEQEWD